MADPAVVHSDLEKWACGWYRARIAELKAAHPELDGFEVDRVEPSVDAIDFPEKLLVLRDDGGPGGLLTAERALGISVLMGNQADVEDVKRAAAIFLGLAWRMPEAGDGSIEGVRNPVASVEEVTGATLVPEAQDRARAFGTATIRVTPEPL